MMANTAPSKIMNNVAPPTNPTAFRVAVNTPKVSCQIIPAQTTQALGRWGKICMVSEVKVLIFQLLAFIFTKFLQNSFV